MNHRRIQVADDGYYHVISRVSSGRFLLEGCERAILYRYIRSAARFCGVEVLTFSLMSNHVHLLIKVPQKRDVGDAELVQRMRGLYGDRRTDEIMGQWTRWERIDGSPRRRLEAQKALRARMYSLPQFCKTFKEIYAMNYNERNAHVTSVWGGQRYKSVLLSPDPHTLLSVASYIERNPVRAKICRSAAESPVSALGMAMSGDGFARSSLCNLIRALQGENVSWASAASRYAGMLGCALPESSGLVAELGDLKAVRQSARVRHFVDSVILGTREYVERFLGKALGNRFHRVFAAPGKSVKGLFAPVRLRGDDSGYGNGAPAETSK